MRLLLLFAGLSTFALLIAGCGSGPSVPPYPEGADEEQIQAVVGYFNTAAEELDAGVLCDEVIAPSAQEGSEGECSDIVGPSMEESPENWEPITDLVDVEISRDVASATGMQLRVDRSGMEAEREIPLEFVRESGRWWMVVFD